MLELVYHDSENRALHVYLECEALKTDLSLPLLPASTFSSGPAETIAQTDLTIGATWAPDDSDPGVQGLGAAPAPVTGVADVFASHPSQ